MSTIGALRLYFRASGPWVTWSVSLPRLAWFICAWMWDRLVSQRFAYRVASQSPPHWVCPLPPCAQGLPASILCTQCHRFLCLDSSLTGLPTPPHLLVWVNVYFNSLVVGLTYSSIFCQFWLFFVFKLLLSLFLIVQGGIVCQPTPPSWPEVPLFFFKVDFNPPLDLV
ncbi:hypothetical protein HJG60_010853 [Phyllostomus discolor]|uniref:Uncharacterized protein n=1 Tax=Phyllostomus discolor TaxID=89673 RepID=A0A834A7P2_9CHIR|nr:hypothetical protein HJG60_010853 [Phyllostomus discolor]